MPDSHSGYGAPIGTVFAMDSEVGYVSPGAVGYDINCGMRLITTNLAYNEIKKYLEKLLDQLFFSVPAGVGRKGFLKVGKEEFKKLVEGGVQTLISKRGIGLKQDLEKIEEKGTINNADFSLISDDAIDRGINQLGTLGSGNHYLEIQKVEEIFDKKIADNLGIFEKNQIVIMV